MSARLRNHLMRNAVAYVALFLTLFLGTAWALEANSVKSKHIVDGQVKAKDLAGVEALEGTGDVLLNDAAGGSPTVEAIATIGSFKVNAACDENPEGTVEAALVARDTASDGSWSFDSTAPNGDNDDSGLTDEDGESVIVVGPTTSPHYDTGSWSLHGEGQALQGLASAGTHDDGADCRFGLTVLG